MSINPIGQGVLSAPYSGEYVKNTAQKIISETSKMSGSEKIVEKAVKGVKNSPIKDSFVKGPNWPASAEKVIKGRKTKLAAGIAVAAAVIGVGAKFVSDKIKASKEEPAAKAAE